MLTTTTGRKYELRTAGGTAGADMTEGWSGGGQASFTRRIVTAIDAHPLPTLILVVGVLSFFLWNKVDSATQAFYNATYRVDSLVKDMGGAEADIKNIRTETDKIEGIRNSLRTLQTIVSSIDVQTKAIDEIVKNNRTFESRLVESFGVEVDKDLLVNVLEGSVVSYPLTPKKTMELELRQFRKTSKTINQPVFSIGYLIPEASAAYLSASPPTLPPLPPTRPPQLLSPQRAPVGGGAR